MKMNNNWATAALAATAMIIGTAPAAAFPAAAGGMPSVSEAGSDSANLQRKGGGARAGGGHAAGAARPAGGAHAGTRPTRQAGTAHNVRSTSGASINGNHARNVNRNTNRNVNRNTNINRDVNIDVDHHGGWDNDWNDHYHPIATAAAIGTTAAIVGSIVSRPPTTGCVTQIYNGISYTQCGSTWYQPQYAGTTVQYIVVNPPY